MENTFSNRDIIATADFSKGEILHVLDVAKSRKNSQDKPLNDKILGSCFFEPSTRTRLSFEAAMYRMGGKVLGFADHIETSTKKGENLSDSMKMVEQYTDVVVMRHPFEGSSQFIADEINIPVINAGDGANQHPTQTFLDLFTILESQGRLENLNIALMGDLKNGRTVHSLAQALTFFNPRLYLISPHVLEMPKEIINELRDKRIKFSFHKDVEEVIHKLDILYCTRVQQERFSRKLDFDAVKNSYSLRLEHLKNVRDHFKILHPLPRVNEIDPSIDKTKYAYYFQQAKNGLPIREALLGLILGALC